MISNKRTSFQAPEAIILWLFFLLTLTTGFASAEDKIGLDLEWRPITGAEKPAPPPPQKARLYVETTPKDARVRILNIGPVFRQGMELAPARYHVEVSADGYKTEDRWLSFGAVDETLRFELERVPAARPERKPASTGGSRVETVTVNGVSFKMVRIPAGEFVMGSPSGESGRDSDEKQHRVRISKPFWIGETEVTQGLWRAVMGSNPSYFKNCGGELPGGAGFLE